MWCIFNMDSEVIYVVTFRVAYINVYETMNLVVILSDKIRYK